MKFRTSAALLIAGTAMLATGIWLMAAHADTATRDTSPSPAASLHHAQHLNIRTALAGYVLSLGGVAMGVTGLIRLKKSSAKTHTLTLDFTETKKTT
ncbi:MAG: hypothetical protein N2044_12635 [Cyclobacteriaceae bacterium]|nr:hypothetical protein [Cyclobacteriaceae bacterium]MCX7638682.1 hypothetical protein [Cyclobacteriaceae bacterium]MDW8332444.1 hypothetical protein [Cyclobacteriaceae bacterium]